jgi:pyruvate, water dikinase
MRCWITLTVVLLAAAPTQGLAKGRKHFLKAVSDRNVFNTLAERQAESFAQGTAELKFIVSKPKGKPVCWFFNSRRYPSHFEFAKDVLGEIRQLRDFRQAAYFSDTRRFIPGEIVAHDQWLGPDGKRGLYTLSFWPADTIGVDQIALTYRLVSKGLPFAQLRYHPSGAGQQRLYAEQKSRFAALGIPVISTEELFRGRDCVALNSGEAIGRLRILGRTKEKIPPTFRDVVVYRFAPNDLPHVAGVITEEPQTPLSHINLVARQNRTPNAYLKNASQDPRITALVGKLVRLRVTTEGIEIEGVSDAEAKAHWTRVRPKKVQRPKRSLVTGKIKRLSKIRFKERHAFGAKTVGVAELGRVPSALRVPQGYGVPFQLYHRFMEALGFYESVKELLADPKFQADAATRRSALKRLRKQIKKSRVPPALAKKLEAMHARFPKGQALRCRSSANSEDLVGFSGAGLYNSYTHRKHEGAITKSIKQVWASLWTFRAFEERAFWRIDHLRAAMGVLVHPNFDDERANGVAVSKNLLAPKWEGTYVNVQRGELQQVTNPLDAQPEEFVVTAIGPFVRAPLDPTGNGRARETIYLRRSSLVPRGKTVLSAEQVLELDLATRAIHKHFGRVYHKEDDPDFALDVEFKIDAAGDLVFKQARPWVD